MKLYLMIKTHNITGKKYLCKKQAETEKLAIRYSGSGLKWKLHIKEFGKDFTTEILFVCPIENKEEFKKVAIDYSHKLNILNNPVWMNMILEDGGGGSTSETNFSKGRKWIYRGDERKTVTLDMLSHYLNNGWILGFPENFKKILSENMKGKTPYNKGKMLKSLTEYKSKATKRKYNIPIIHTTNKTKSVSSYTKELRSINSKIHLNKPEVLAKFKVPRKPLITAVNIITNETKTLGRQQWYLTHKVDYRKLLKGYTSKNWRLVVTS